MRLPERVASFAYPAAGLLAIVAAWYVVTALRWVPDYLLPAPGKVGAALLRSLSDGTMARHLLPTLQATVVGYAAGCLAAVALAALVSEFRWVERALLLHLLALQSIPKVSIAPLIFLWLGFDIAGKIVLVALICFFPVFANALAGLRAVDADLHDLMRAAGAGRWHVWWHLKLPGALRHVFAGLEVSAAFALIGCVVMEFVGATRGMGFMIQDASSTYDLPLSFAAILVLGAVGLVGNALVRAVRARVLFWEPAAARETDGGAGRA